MTANRKTTGQPSAPDMKVGEFDPTEAIRILSGLFGERAKSTPPPQRQAKSKPRFVGHAQQNGRRTKADIATIKETIRDILREAHPMTVRQVFYQLVTRGTIEKT